MFCDYFLYLLYIGLYELRIDILRKYLGTLFTVDEIRRLMSEAIVPSIKMWRAQRAKKAEREKTDGKNSYKEFKKTQQYADEKESEELEKQHYETFDDYFEMIVTFGYLTLFAGKIC